MLIFMNVANALVFLFYAAHCGWLGENIQHKIQYRLSIDHEYDRELLYILAQIQAGNGTCRLNNDNMIFLQTENKNIVIYADDYADEKFGTPYYYKNKYSSEYNITLKTRKYLLDFKENFMGIKDPSSTKRTCFSIKQKVTIE